MDMSTDELEAALDRLSRIVKTLEADAGFWVGPSGEKIRVINGAGHIFSSREAISVLTVLVCEANNEGRLVVPVAAPQAVDELAKAAGLAVERTRSDGCSLVDAARNRQVRFVASMDDRFGFPKFQSNFDGLFATAKIMELTVGAELSLDQAFAKLPRNHYHHLELSCPWESKGGLMRRMSEHADDQQASFTDGVRIDTEQGWVLVLPDQHRPISHIYVEATEEKAANELLELYRVKVSGWLAELADVDPS
jgi:mannose-1-phosphate guanylyltransferase/phosphomannomutase